MKRLKYIFIMVMGLSVSSDLYAQDPTFTQFYANPLYLNPAFAGSHGCPRFNMNYRNEWPSLSSNYVTYSASYDSYFKGISGGLGVIATHDRQGSGTIQTSNLGLIYSFHLKFSRKFSLLFGAKANWTQKFLDWDNLKFGDQIDERKGFIYQTGDIRNNGSRGFFDASTGVVGLSKRFFFGVAAHHLNMPNESMLDQESKMPIRWTGHLGSDIVISNRSRFETKTSIMPNVIFQYQRGFMEMNIGTYIKHGAFQAGVWFRNRDAFILTLGVSTSSMRIGYSYDITVSKLNNGVSGGSHEISLGFNLKCRDKQPRYNMNSCPSF